MGAPQTLRFAGRGAPAGLVVMGIFGLVMGAVAVGLVLLFATGALAEPGLLAGAGVLGALAALLIRQVARDWRLFSTLEIDADGTWRLRNPGGVVLHTLAPGDARAVDEIERESWLFMGTPRRARLSWLRIELPDGRVFHSARSTARFQAEAKAALREHVRTAGRASPGGAG
jgi:hypothetical protein